MSSSPQPTSTSHLPPAGTEAPEVQVQMARRIAGGLLSGLVAGLGMYATLAAFAVAQGRGLGYPLHAVQALMSGARVLPDYPRGNLVEPQATDAVMGPFYFFLPALLVGALTAWWIGRRARTGVVDRWPTVAVGPAVVLTVAFFVAFVLVIGFREATPVAQRVSSGYGVRELGLAAWLSAHLVYALVLVAVTGPLTTWTSALGSREPRRAGLRGE
jgi:hypothetical protein